MMIDGWMRFYGRTKRRSRAMEKSGKLFAMADKAADLTILGIVWLLTSIPVITLGTSCTALYYAVAKSVRASEGRPVKEYFRAWRQNALQGCAATGLFLMAAALLMLDGYIMQGNVVFWIILSLFILLAAVGVYFFPVLSRFSLTLRQCFQVSVVMAISCAPKTCLLLLTLALCVAVFWIFPFLLPVLAAFYAYYTTFILEGIFREYTEPQVTAHG